MGKNHSKVSKKEEMKLKLRLSISIFSNISTKLTSPLGTKTCTRRGALYLIYPRTQTWRTCSIISPRFQSQNCVILIPDGVTQTRINLETTADLNTTVQEPPLSTALSRPTWPDSIDPTAFSSVRSASGKVVSPVMDTKKLFKTISPRVRPTRTRSCTLSTRGTNWLSQHRT